MKLRQLITTKRYFHVYSGLPTFKVLLLPESWTYFVLLKIIKEKEMERVQ